MDVETSNGLLAALGLKLVNVVVGAVSSFVSLRFFENLHLLEKWTTFIGGWAIACWGAGPVTEYFQLKPKMEVGMVIILGLFGMALTAAVIRVIKDTDWSGLIKVVINATFGRRNGDK